MNATFTNVLIHGPLFRNELGVLHISRTSDQDVECKLLNGNPSEFGFLSAIREVADGETQDSFSGSKAEYVAIAKAVETLAKFAGAEFAESYRVVARLVREHSNTL
jgi:hypothetical protein